jgi:hypothetical protein
MIELNDIFLEDMMTKLGFCQNWRQLIMKCVRNGSARSSEECTRTRSGSTQCFGAAKWQLFLYSITEFKA